MERLEMRMRGFNQRRRKITDTHERNQRRSLTRMMRQSWELTRFISVQKMMEGL
jgi:hypothetical protein